MRWLLLKDLRVLGRSPLLVALLVLYPVLVAALIGFALSRGPERPRVALLNQVAEGTGEIDLGGQRIDTASYGRAFLRQVDAVPVSSRREALELVRDGRVLGAIIIPADLTGRLQSGLESSSIEVLYNAEDPVKARYLEDLVKSQIQDANAQLTRAFSRVALQYLDLIIRGGRVSFLGREVDVLGLERSEQILRAAQADLPEDSPVREQLRQVIDFAGSARRNLDLADEALASVGEPIRVRTQVVEGGGTTLSLFAVAVAVTVTLMFVTLLLAAGTLALEREENAFPRLVRGLVSRTALLVEKVGLAAVCSLAVALVMLLGLSLFVELELERAGLWALALAGGALAFAAMGVAIGAVAREVRAASLLAFMLSLPIAFLALVPSGAVSSGLYAVIRGLSALFPFQPALDALEAALDGTGGLGLALAHLAALTVLFGALARLGLRRFA
jgi:ABC-2 type transport system permease protein